jgi:hypothetical protein
MPESIPTAKKGARVAPNEGNFPVDASVNVFTDDGHLFNFKIAKKGPSQPDYLITLVNSEPPITEQPPYEKEVYVREDKIVEGQEFTLDSSMPVIIGKTTFKAINIFANVEVAVIPLVEFEEPKN